MLRIDLETAGIPYVVEGPDGPLCADFHSLRHSFLTLLGKGGVDLRTAQELAGHSTPTLTMRYSHRRLHDLAVAVEKLPAFLPDATRGREALRATGTDDARPLLDDDQNVLALCLALSERSERISVDSDRLKQESSRFPQTVIPLEKPAENPHNSTVRRDGRAADCTGLENRQHESVRGFESLSLRSVQSDASW